MAKMFGVTGQWNAALAIGGKDYPINPTTVQELNWFETIHQQLPSLSLTLKDYDGSFSTIAGAGDGVPIDITLGDGGVAGETTGQFNILGQPQISHGSGYSVIKLNAVLNGLPYMRSVANGFFNGSAADVISMIAGKAGLTADVDPTNDKQVWLPNNKTLAGFVRHVANHSWVDVGSLLMVAVTDQKKLLLKNVAKPQSSGEVFDHGPGNTPIIDWMGTSNAMITNQNRGYGSTSFGFDATGILQELNKVTFNMFSAFLPVSAANIASIGTLGGRLDSIIRSAGNTHDKYEEAKHQNTRMRALYSSDLNILVAQASHSELLKEVHAVPYDFSTSLPNPVLSGPYVLTARTKSLVRSKYVERCTLTTSGSS